MKLKSVSLLLLALAALPALASADTSGAQLVAGKKLYKSACIACHGTGAAGAPRIGNKQEWAPYLGGGIDKMVNVAIQGKGGMPPRGGTSADDTSLRAAIEYMASRLASD